PRPLPAGGLATRVRRTGDRPGAGRRLPHGRRRGTAAALAARLFPAPRRSQGADHYEVDRIRDGKSFTTRRVSAIQHGRAIFTMAVSFHHDEPGMSHQARMPEVAKPEELPNEADIKERVLPLMPDPVRRYYERERPIEWRPVELDRYLGKTIEDGRFHVWIRATAQLPDAPAIHQCVLAYRSDMLLLDSALIPH